MHVVLLGLLALISGASAQAGGGGPCPDTPTMQSNSTNCILIGSPNKCKGVYVVVSMTGDDQAVPCEWDVFSGLCNGRLDCAFDAPGNTTDCPEIPYRQAEDNMCSNHDSDMSMCEGRYTMQKMTGSFFDFPCVYDKKSMQCQPDLNCGEKRTKPTPAPTTLPSMLPSMTPTTTPTTVPTKPPTTVPTGFPTTVPTVSPTSVPTKLPTRDPTPTPTTAPVDEDICHLFNDDAENCVIFDCFYNYNVDECLLEDGPGYQCGTFNAKNKCKKDDECEWDPQNKKCNPKLVPTPEPTTGDFCSQLFFTEQECAEWYDFAGCLWDSHAEVCRDWGDTFSPTPAPTAEPTNESCKTLYNRKKTCQKDSACEWVDGICEDVTFRPTVMPTTGGVDCYVDFLGEYYGREEAGRELCLARDPQLGCVIVEDNFFGTLCVEFDDCTEFTENKQSEACSAQEECTWKQNQKKCRNA